MYMRMLDGGQYDRYMQRIESLLRDIRNFCFGFQIPITAILPIHMKDLPDKEKAQHLAKQLSFSLASVSGCTQPQISSSYHWFYESIWFLFDRCPPSDHIFDSLFKIYSLDLAVRKMLFGDWQEEATFLCSEPKAPFATSVLEQAVLHLIAVNKQTGKIAGSVSKLCDFRNDFVVKKLMDLN